MGTYTLHVKQIAKGAGDEVVFGKLRLAEMTSKKTELCLAWKLFDILEILLHSVTAVRGAEE